MFGRRHFAVVACAACRTHRILPKAAADEVAAEVLYNEYEPPDVAEFHAEKHAAHTAHMLRRFQQIKMSFNPTTKVLDVGCGVGITLESICERFGCLGKGIDVDKRRIAVAQASAKRAKFECGLFDPAEIGETYDVVLSTAVIEHVVDPVVFLKGLNSVLAPEGELFVLTPNASSLNYRLLRSWWRELLSIGEHIYLFTPESLQDCARQAGLRVMNFSSDYDFQFPGLRFGSAKELVITAWWVYRTAIKCAAQSLSTSRTGDILYARLKKI